MTVRTWTRRTSRTKSRGHIKRYSLAVGAACLLLAACAGRPSADDLTNSILRASAGEAVELSDAQAECIASALLDSDLEDVTISGLAENFDEPEVAVADAGDVETVVARAAVTCSGS